MSIADVMHAERCCHGCLLPVLCPCHRHVSGAVLGFGRRLLLQGGHRTAPCTGHVTDTFWAEAAPLALVPPQHACVTSCSASHADGHGTDERIVNAQCAVAAPMQRPS